MDRAGIEPAKPCTPNRQSSDVRKNDRRSDVSENLRRSIQAELRRIDLHQSRAGGIRTHDIRLLKHVLQLGSRSCPTVSSQLKVTNACVCTESNPQGLSCKLGRLPTGPVAIRLPFQFSSSTRNRTWNFSLEARDDIRFTIEPTCPRHSVEPTERKARELNPHDCFVALFSKQARQTVSGYLPSFEWSHRDSNSGFRHAMAMSSRWTMTPFHAEVRSRIELDLRSYQERVLPEHLQTD